jgi:beta-glucosidase
MTHMMNKKGIKDKPAFKEVAKDGYHLIIQDDGPSLGYSPQSGIGMVIEDGLVFKDFRKTGKLEPYADWRLSAEKRAQDLASKLSVDEIAGLMLYSPQNKLPMLDDTYGGKSFAESNAKASDLSDSQIEFLATGNLRHILVSQVESPEVAARWNNKVQALVEGCQFGIPANNSSDPRHSAVADAEFSAGSGGAISMWSSMLGMAATFDPALIEQFGRIASKEYRALGLATALSPQADLGTDPRWYRYSSTFGPNPRLVTDMTRAYCDGFQTSEGKNEIADGWGYDSVNAMVKHWPGGGTGEGGRDAHYGNGKFAVYPGGQFDTHKIPFIEGAFNLSGKTGKASAVMPYYTIAYNQTAENVANGFNKDIIGRQLREELGYDGVVCTDWLITHDEVAPGVHSGKPWGVEEMSETDRHYKALMAGVDQFGGNNRKEPVIKAYEKGICELGETNIRKRFELSAYRLLLNMFRTGLFENPYVDVEETVKTVGAPEHMRSGYTQQIKSIVMLKNKNGVLPVAKRKKVFIPPYTSPAGPNFWRVQQNEKTFDPVHHALLDAYFEKVASPDDADFAIVFIRSPFSLHMGYDSNEVENGGTGYVPISLQYGGYTAEDAREHSIAGGDPFEGFINRSYKGKTARTLNEKDLLQLQQVRTSMGDKPLVLVVNVANPMVMKEVEPLADAIIVDFDVQKQAVLDIISGSHEPSGLLPMQLPKDMQSVEKHCEDVPQDMECYVDSEGNMYDFAFGLNWDGIIDDNRARYYKKRPF